jgi:phosphopantothenoylcysteine decarboxylase/phosphopantothenate--cysteine ligase
MSRPLVVLGVTGGIAAYKSADLIRRLKEQDLDVQVITTKSALKFVGETTFAALSGHPVISDIWNNAHEVEHVNVAKKADAIVVAPATADFLAHLAYGFANDVLLATLLVAKCPIILAPAMHTEMWENSATKENVATLRKRGFLVLDPAVGKLTGEDSGVGRLPETTEIAQVVKQVINRKNANLGKDLVGLNVLISAGGTREAIDPIRFIGNRASGKQGVALALSALSRGAKVTLVGANLSVNVPAGVEFISANTAKEMQEQMQLRAGSADVVIMNAAVADYFIAIPDENKIKKKDEKLAIELDKTTDILSVLADSKPIKQYLVGFAAETTTDDDDLIASAKSKLESKKADLIVGNKVSKSVGISSDENEVIMVTANEAVLLPKADKLLLADAMWDFIVKQLAKVGREEKSPVEPDLA